jgi:hypothetical protein
MRRREFIAGLGSEAAWSVVARAQQAALPVIGLLQLERPPPGTSRDFARGSRIWAMSKGRTWPLSMDLRRTDLIGCRRLQPISSAAA